MESSGDRADAAIMTRSWVLSPEQLFVKPAPVPTYRVTTGTRQRKASSAGEPGYHPPAGAQQRRGGHRRTDARPPKGRWLMNLVVAKGTRRIVNGLKIASVVLHTELAVKV
jgi:hypothetical protein